MSHFIVRVEFHGVSDYSTLHAAMQAQAYHRVIRDTMTNSGVYELPPAVYSHISDQTIVQVLTAVKSIVHQALAHESQAVKTQNATPTVLVSKIQEVRWSGLTWVSQ